MKSFSAEGGVMIDLNGEDLMAAIEALEEWLDGPGIDEPERAAQVRRTVVAFKTIIRNVSGLQLIPMRKPPRHLKLVE